MHIHKSLYIRFIVDDFTSIYIKRIDVLKNRGILKVDGIDFELP